MTQSCQKMHSKVTVGTVDGRVKLQLLSLFNLLISQDDFENGLIVGQDIFM